MGQEKSLEPLSFFRRCWSNRVAGHMVFLFEAFNNLRFRKQVSCPEDIFWSMDQPPGALRSLQGQKSIYSLLSHLCCWTKNVKCLYGNSNRLVTERILFEDFSRRILREGLKQEVSFDSR